MTASYLQNNDYTALQLRKPYQLPVNDIAQTVATLDSYWKQGAARVKAQYENVAGLNLTLDPLKSYTQDFLKQAQDQLKKLSTKDLSSRDVQMEGMNLFKPILSGDNDMSQKILQDHAITNMRNSIISEAQMYKTKDGGKGYNDNNLRVALSAFKGFGVDTDPNQLGAIYEKAKNARYTPFYDISKERMDILKNCDPGSVSSTIPNEEWIVESTDESLSQAKLYGCLKGAYSENARNQIRIDALARYDGNINALKTEYISSAEQQVKYLNKLKAELEAEKQVALKKKETFTKEDQLKLVDNELTSFNTDLKTYQTWQDKDWEDRYENLAYVAYFKVSNEAFAEAFARENKSVVYTPNPYGVAKYKEDRQDAREEKRFQNEMTLKEIDYKNKILSGLNSDGSKMDPLAQYKEAQRLHSTGMLTDVEFSNFLTLGQENKGISYNVIQQKVQESWNQEYNTIVETLKYANTVPELKEIIKDLNLGDLNNFKWKDYGDFWRRVNKYVDNILSDNNTQNDVVANRLKSAYNSLIKTGNEKNLYQGIINDAKNEVLNSTEGKTAQANFNKIANETLVKLQNKYPNISFRNGENINANRLASIFKGEDNNYKVVQDPYLQGDVDSYHILDIKNNKRVFEFSKTFLPYTNLYDIYDEFKTNVSKKQNDINNLINKNIENRTITQRFVLGLGDITENKRVMSDLQTLYGSNLGAIGKDVKFNSVNGVDVVNGKIRLQAVNKDGESIPYDKLRDGIQKGVMGGLEINQIDDNTIELTLPSLKGITQKPTYYDVLKTSIGIITKNPQSIPAEGITKVLGKDPRGTQFELKINKEIGGVNPEYVLISKSPNGTANSKIIPAHQLDGLIASISKALEGNQ